MITSVYFENFKVLDKYSISLKDFNILVGINNCGKSTILDAFRILFGAYRYASRYKPKYIRSSDKSRTLGWEIPDSSIPILLDNVQTDLSDEPAKIKYRFSTNKSLTIHFEKDKLVKLTFEVPGKEPTSASSFRKLFNLSLAIIPTLGPFEIEEEVYDEPYVNRWFGSRRASRLFRNYWYCNSLNFELFKKELEKTWPGMSIKYPEKPDHFSNRLFMFFEENRIPREICWGGFGFQIWLQLLTHIIKNRNSDILVVDEPEVYLHPDLQHKILRLLRTVSSKVILATHSVELINEAEPNEVLIIDRNNRSAKRLSDITGLQIASDLIGSSQNLNLTRLARGKRILFVEGKDLKTLNKLAEVAGYKNLFDNTKLTVIPIMGFSQYNKILGTNWTFSRIIGENIRLSALFDRDYKCDEEIEEFIHKLEKEVEFIHVFAKKELENYLLVPSAIDKAIQEKLNARFSTESKKKPRLVKSEIFLNEIADGQKQLIISQQASHKYNYLKSSRCDDLAVIINQQHRYIEKNWVNISYRYSVIPGKEVLSILNRKLEAEYRISLTHNMIIRHLKKTDIDVDIISLFEKIRLFI